MAKTTDFLSQTRGKLDSMFQTHQTDHGTILARNPRRTGRRSEKQANMRCQMPNAAANYSLFHPMLNDAFEGKTAGQNDYNIFIQVNYGKNPIFITKQDSSCGGCVLGNYQYSRGSLNPIAITLGSNGVLSTGLGLGSLVIGAQTTVAELSAAIIANNKDWVVDDQLTFFYGEQYVDSEGVPRATMEAFRMVLSMDDATPVWNMVPALGFSTVDGKLGMNAALQNAGASWIHSRNLSDGGTQVSTQRMKVVSDLMVDYQGDEAMLASAASYGGINSKKVFLNPMSTLADVSAAINQNENQNQNGSSGSSGSSSGTGTGTQSGGGSSSGGSSENPETE